MTSTSTTDFYTSPVYEYSNATIPLSKEVLDDYKTKITDEIFRESPFLSLLRKKTEEAKNEMVNELNTQLFGAPKSLKEIISEAYDEHMPKEAEVSIASEAVNKVMRERAEARAAEVVEAISDQIAGAETGHLVAWTTQFRAGGKEYNYAATLAGDGLWYVTNRNGGLDTETFISLIAEQAIDGTVDFEGTVL